MYKRQGLSQWPDCTDCFVVSRWQIKRVSGKKSSHRKKKIRRYQKSVDHTAVSYLKLIGYELINIYSRKSSHLGEKVRYRSYSGRSNISHSIVKTITPNIINLACLKSCDARLCPALHYTITNGNYLQLGRQIYQALSSVFFCFTKRLFQFLTVRYCFYLGMIFPILRTWWLLLNPTIASNPFTEDWSPALGICR